MHHPDLFEGRLEHRKLHPRLLLHVWEFLGPYRAYWIGSLILTLAMSGASLLIPWLTQKGIDDGIRAHNLPVLMHLVWIVLGLQVFNLLVGLWQGQLLTWLGQGAVHDLRVALFSHLQSLSLDFYEKEQPGRIISRAINDLDAVSELISGGIMSAVADVILLVGVVIILFRYNMALAAMVVAFFPVLVVLAYLFQGRIRTVFTHARETIAAVTSYLHETAAGIRVVKSLARESLSEKHFDGLNLKNAKANANVGAVFAIFMPVADITQGMAICAVLWFGGLLISKGAMQIGVLVAFLLYVNQFFEPVRRLIELFASVPRALVGLNRILEILERKPTVQDALGAKPLGQINGEVEFRKLAFSYDGRHPVVEDINLRAGFGDMIALVGHTGAGKSTLMKLLTRMYDAQEGEILIDGQDVRQVTQESLRGQMGMVQQETFLFAGSVKENIRYGRPEATDEEVEAAAKMVFAHDFIMRLPQGYETDISERGVRLSGGQRQLVAFARAVLKNPRILILDEATSSVDHFTEVQIQEAMKTLLKDRVSFVIAHRISTVRHADQILLLENGHIVARGKHEELAASSSLYRALYERRFLPPENN